MDTAPTGAVWGLGGGILGSFLERPLELSNIKICSKTSRTAPQGPRFHLTRYEFWLGAYVESQPGRCPGWAWGGGLDPPKTKLVSNTSHTAPQGPIINLVRYEFWLGAYVEFQPVG